jgi:predicted TIM-barrel fold metal-dependent hydrolase
MEAILEPDLPICDPHHHLWGDEPHTTYPHPYRIDALEADVHSGHNVVKTVFVECRTHYRTEGPEAFRSVGEVEFVVRSDPSGFIAGIVGSADLRLPEVADVLDALGEASAGRFRGIRQITVWDADPGVSLARPNSPGMLAEPAFDRGLDALARKGLIYDAWLYHPQLPELVAAARAHPDLSIVLNHLGGPLGVGHYRDDPEEVRVNWRRAMTELATCENVAIKLGGLGSACFGRGWEERPEGASAEEIADSFGDDIRWCIATFGADRCMFESNFPADKGSFSYATIWNAYKRIVADASPDEKRALFCDTASRVYRV